ncbi:DUF732 domain-containing protein [Mycolicibacterium septicum]|uniref:DUF732 domain-containing protein n=1 Tax=Mycolicibacterium septicum TaxID=98668 RepID=UPI001AF44CCC|nr:DUF732 domain-containing protein [Mycolicibacterium septicum]QRY51761.1 DUF732 domain-containing protein [Mycolicibacterium septicum]
MNDLETQAAPTQASESTLAYSDAMDIPEVQTRRPWKVVVGIAAGIVALGGVAALGVMQFGHPGEVQPVAQPVKDLPTSPADQAFIDNLYRTNVPAPDWRYAVGKAQALCGSLTQLKTPGGSYTVNIAREAVKGDHKDWNDAQVYNYVGATFETYCPQFWGPTPEALTAMTPDERFVALIGDRTGLHPNDGTMIAAGHEICPAMSFGYNAVVDAVQKNNADQKGWNRSRAETFVDTALEVYCPQ